ncbi:MAG TPA: hypothetical protein VFP61_00775 [Acidimicrobiales bacterium]|nr:hypothetical protein [Acidimicrobiales bacterium]
MSTTDLYAGVAELTTGLGPDEAAARLLELAGGDRRAIEAVRDRYARHLHGRADDFAATAALTICNRALAAERPADPLDWKRRWARGRKP